MSRMSSWLLPRQDETQSVISDLRDEIARLRSKIMKIPDDQESVVKMEVNTTVICWRVISLSII